jgi:D-aminoacyl-tRNA deacylase
MRVVIQRVNEAHVKINSSDERAIGAGLLILVGIEDSDGQEDVEWLSAKIMNLRIFDDESGIMNHSILETHGDLMVISQFTLHASTRKGNRPSYIRAAKPIIAIPIYEAFVQKLRQQTSKPVVTGEFGAHMEIELVNDGPVTILIDTKNKE